MKTTLIQKMIFGLFMLAFILFGFALYIPVKAQVAQYLLQSAWHKALISNVSIPPWPWADTYPVARMVIPKIDLDAIVLSGATGATLAFAPGHIKDSALPGDIGQSLISAHKDTHFRNIDKLKLNDSIFIEKQNGFMVEYKVSEKRVINIKKESLSLYAEKEKLGLISCYPLSGVYSNPDKRYMVFAQKVLKI